jgi:hypothetical protein
VSDIGSARKTLADRLNRYTKASGDCLAWTGYRDKHGYGRMSFEGKPRKVASVVWESIHGAIPTGKCILHTCDNPPCVRGSHLYAGSRKQNTRDAIQRGRLDVQSWIQYGEKHHNAKLTRKRVEYAKLLREQGMSYAKIAIRLGVAKQTAMSAVKGNTWGMR